MARRNIIKTVFYSLAGIVLCFVLGFIASRLQMTSLAEWYPGLNKSPLTPPSSVFPVAWGILYTCIGISLGLVLASTGPQKKLCLQIFAVQLFLNFIWSIAFFTFRSPLAGMGVITALILCSIAYAWLVRLQSPPAAVLFIPYIGWLAFAAYLNLYILQHN